MSIETSISELATAITLLANVIKEQQAVPPAVTEEPPVNAPKKTKGPAPKKAEAPVVEPPPIVNELAEEEPGVPPLVVDDTPGVVSNIEYTLPKITEALMRIAKQSAERRSTVVGIRNSFGVTTIADLPEPRFAEMGAIIAELDPEVHADVFET